MTISPEQGSLGDSFFSEAVNREARVKASSHTHHTIRPSPHSIYFLSLVTRLWTIPLSYQWFILCELSWHQWWCLEEIQPWLADGLSPIQTVWSDIVNCVFFLISFLAKIGDSQGGGGVLVGVIRNPHGAQVGSLKLVSISHREPVHHCSGAKNEF